MKPDTIASPVPTDVSSLATSYPSKVSGRDLEVSWSNTG